ncbi:uncharacterized protein LOC125059057 [Pieris napi]|uniref:uncharacterized protein LOC125059057 n=1 Tax=Pieris napi TaxID=78633 RepID=UPI001FBBCD22|nr:uncharacterized protein LOC125059057 [Pieris napi]
MSFDTERFIVEIQNRPCLWDASLSEYSDRNMKIKCWEEIVDTFKEQDNLTVQEKQHFAESLQKRWKSIRGCYTREVNRKKSVKSGSGCGSRKSEYIYYKQLQFLQKVVSIRAPDPTSATVDPSNSEDNPEHVTQEIRQLHGRKKQKTKENTEDNKFIAFLNKSKREKCEIGNQDEDKLFLLSLVGTLKKVPPNRKMATKIKIMTILNEETCNEQTQNTRDYWSSPPPDRPS